MKKSKLYIVFIFLMSFLFVNAQDQDKRAFSLMKKNKYYEAKIIYDSLIKHNKATTLDYFYAAKTYYQIKTASAPSNDIELLLKADSLFQIFQQRQPKSINGYIWRGRVNALIDSTFKKGLAVQFYESAFEIAKVDTVKYTKELFEIYDFFHLFYIHKAKFYTDKWLNHPLYQEKIYEKIKAE